MRVDSHEPQAAAFGDGDMQGIPGAQPKVWPVEETGGSLEMIGDDGDFRKIVLPEAPPVVPGGDAVFHRIGAGADLDRKRAGDFGGGPSTAQDRIGGMLAQPAPDCLAMHFLRDRGDGGGSVEVEHQ